MGMPEAARLAGVRDGVRCAPGPRPGCQFMQSAQVLPPMSMVCPQCHGSYSQRLHCPACNVRLEYRTGASGRRPALSGDRNAWQHTPWGRILIGLLLAQGLYYGLWHLGQALAGLLAVNSEA